jgi:ADP-heptose:LPS heptosyltransferase
VKLEEDDSEVIDLNYPLIHKSNSTPHHFVHGFVQDLEEKLGIRIPCTELKGEIFISNQERNWISQVAETGCTTPFWIINAGGKYDYTAKWWHPDYYQEVVNHFQGKIQFVQIGAKEHWHPKLNGVIDLVGKTSLRQLIRLIHHSSGVLCPVTFVMHAAAAIPTRTPKVPNRPCVVVAGSREPVHWESYPFHRYLHNMGALSCCAHGACWKSRATTITDNDKKNNLDQLCSQTVEINPLVDVPMAQVSGPVKIGKCFDMIKPEHVIDAIDSYYRGGILQYNDE